MRRFWFFLLFGSVGIVQAQELYPFAEPASTLAHKMIGVKLRNDIFQDISTRTKYFSSLGLQYGLHRYCTISLYTGISNHHLKEIPKNYIYYLLNHHTRRFPEYPVLLEGFYGNAKFRLFSSDRDKSHWRIALLVEGSKSFAAHDEAEPNLMTDNSGYGIHLIGTRLYRRWAINIQAGTIHPTGFTQRESATAAELKVKHSDAYQILLSNGFRIYPSVLKNYDQTNINIYAELMFKQYDKVYVENQGRVVDYSQYKDANAYLYESMSGNAYVDVRSYAQFIFNSQSRLEVGLVYRVFNRSYLHSYPMLTLQFQKFIFGKS